MEGIVQKAIESVQKAKVSFSKFISANDAGLTGAHQSGFYIPKNSIELMFDSPGVKGQNKDRFVQIKWQDEFETESRFIYYGSGSRNEYRLTRFGKGFPFFHDENVGDLLILSKVSDEYYEAFVLNTDEGIEDFLSFFNLTPAETNCLIPKKQDLPPESKLLDCFKAFIDSHLSYFPQTIELATAARNCYNSAYSITNTKIVSDSDSIILGWLHSEFQLFKSIEANVYSDRLQAPFGRIEPLIEFANTILNRRKIRAGKSLEHHLSSVFKTCELKFDEQSKTEGAKTPDFIFPGSVAYQNKSFDENKLVFLASKTTCKDRWRQVLNEADRIKTKHLFTLQQGISPNQLKEMETHRVTLVVPKSYIKTFPEDFHHKILSLGTFLTLVKEKQLA